MSPAETLATLDWTVTRCGDCGAWQDVTTPAFERYGCVACALLLAERDTILGPCQRGR